MTSQPSLQYAPAPCPSCGARNAGEANGICEATQDETGEWTCPATDCEVDRLGRFCFPTEASIKALDDWIGIEAKRQGW